MKSLRVLIVEDDRLVCLMLCDMLTRMGHYVVATATSGPEAIARVKQAQIDLIFMDIRLRGAQDGIETLARIHRNIANSLPGIFMTGLTHDYKDPLLERDAYFLRKPFFMHEVAEAITAVMGPLNEQEVSTA